MAVKSWETKPCCLLLPISHLAKISGQRATLISQECIAGNIIPKYPFGKATLKSFGWHIYFLSKQVYIILGRFRIKYRGHVNKTRWFSGKESAWNAGDSDSISGSTFCPANWLICTIFLDSIHMHWYTIFVFLFPAFFTLYDRLYIHPHHYKWPNLSFLWLIVQCIYLPQLLYPFICWWI